MEVLAIGHVIMTAGEDILVGNRMEMDLEAEVGTVYNGTVFIKENHFYIKGDKIQKTGKDSYAVGKGSLTTCDGDHPAWKITGRNLKVTIEGYGFVNHAALWAKKIPVLYTPFLVFPVKIKRQSGLLPPQILYSERKWEEYIQPFYWAINESSDATDFLQDRKVDNGTTESEEEWGYTDDSVTRPNADRYWFRMKHDQALPSGFTAKLDIDIVSDQDYLHEFKDEESDTTIQMLPVVDFNASKQQISSTPLYFDLDSEYTYFYREDASRAHRMDAYPRIYLPLKFKHYLSVEPSVGLRETAWHFDKEEYRSSDKATLYREMYDVKIDLSSNINRIYSLQKSWIDKIKHAITPQIVYEYIPGKDQSKYPSFDEVDRIARKNLVTYSLTNIFTSRSQTHSIKNDNQKKIDNDEPVNYTYNQFCRLKLEQSYDINEAKEDTPSQWANTKEKRPFSTIYGEIEIDPVQYVSVQADATWCQYDSLVKSRNIAATLSDKRGDRLFVEHRYTYNSSESIYTDMSLVVSDQLKVYADYERNLYSPQDIKKGIGFLYKAQCWSIDFSYTHEDNDRKYAFIINLYGIGEFGRNIVGRMMEEPL
jgi:LPS-assembly protein